MSESRQLKNGILSCCSFGDSYLVPGCLACTDLVRNALIGNGSKQKNCASLWQLCRCPRTACPFPSQLACSPTAAGRTLVIYDVYNLCAAFIVNPCYLPLQNNTFKTFHTGSEWMANLLESQTLKQKQTNKKPTNCCYLRSKIQKIPELAWILWLCFNKDREFYSWSLVSKPGK